MGDWTGKLVRIKPDWLRQDESDIPYLVKEDRGISILVQELPEYSKNYFLGIWCWPKDSCYLIEEK